MDSVISVYKPYGITSAELCGKIKSTLYKKNKIKKLKVGHGGTLDKRAEGVMVIGIGKGCKKLPEYLKGDKVYIGTGFIGIQTDTLDTGGEIIDRQDFNHISEKDFDLVLDKFQGDILQIPPLYSALKIKGKRASDLTMKGIKVELKPRPVTIYSLNKKSFEIKKDGIHFEIEVSVSGGTYIRSLIRDIGKELNSCAYMTSLVRVKQGTFTLEDTIDIDNINI
ncbi:MAG: tRNA pseudouridine(55) synthase TruB [Magnetococcales bacterium]|nr:tRNA pseudouridine(55) synthase TruB [Magnetococcales bacterium]|tara:strand:+ start:2197 stop:2865 length:669 start_codon:yes stop_codon:yes gene_type:complete